MGSAASQQVARRTYGTPNDTVKITAKLNVWPPSQEWLMTNCLSLIEKRFEGYGVHFAVLPGASMQGEFVADPQIRANALMADAQARGQNMPSILLLLAVASPMHLRFDVTPLARDGMRLCGADLECALEVTPKTKRNGMVHIVRITVSGPVAWVQTHATAVSNVDNVPLMDCESAMRIGLRIPQAIASRNAVMEGPCTPRECLGWFRNKLAYFFRLGYRGCVVVDAKTGAVLLYIEPIDLSGD
ncbi:hypothetical protein HDU98_012003 [Podochytrium sp. JEL0797]|nr:hypothetical protein HDU98_012003 [Podochytrium sp. JEL0797]